MPGAPGSGAPGRIRIRDPLLRRPVCAAGQPACSQVSRCIGLSVSDREFAALTGRSGTQRARRPLRPELAAPLGVWSSSQLAECAAGRRCWWLCGDVAVLSCCTVYRISNSVRGVRIGSGWTSVPARSSMHSPRIAPEPLDRLGYCSEIDPEPPCDRSGCRSLAKQTRRVV